MVIRLSFSCHSVVIQLSFGCHSIVIQLSFSCHSIVIQLSVRYTVVASEAIVVKEELTQRKSGEAQRDTEEET